MAHPERPRGLSKSASLNAMPTPASDKKPSLFRSWRKPKRDATTAMTTASDAQHQHAGLDGKQLRDALWKQHRPRDAQAPAAAKPLRVIRCTPPRGTRHAPASAYDGANEDEEDDDDDVSVGDDLSTAGSTRGAGSRRAHNYEDHSPPTGSSSRLGRSQRQLHQQQLDDHGASRLSLTLSRLSFSASARSSARSSIAEYKAKKYDVEWRKDDDVTDCQVCHLAFTKWSRRRHHCRVCGNIICDDCSPDLVLIDGLFTRPKRSCTACFGLLEAMMHLGDSHVRMMIEKEAGARDWVEASPPKKSPGRDKAASGYHDRLVEIQRVTAAGTKAKRSGTGRMCVIKAQWLRAWLAFTKNHDDGDGDDLSGFRGSHRFGSKDRAESVGSAFGSPSSAGDRAPGVIDNLSLLVMKKGVLHPRDGLVASDSQDFAGCGDYQTIPVEVWDVLHRYYGGGPRIEILPSPTAGEPDQWVIDASAVLCFGRALKLNPQAAPGTSTCANTIEEKVIERSLMEKHDPLGILDELGSGCGSSRGGLEIPPAAASPAPAPSPSPAAVLTPSMNRSTSDTPRYSTPAVTANCRMGSAARNGSSKAATRSKPEPPIGHGQHQTHQIPNPERTPSSSVKMKDEVRIATSEPDAEPASSHRQRHNSGSRDLASAAAPVPPYVPRRDTTSQNEPTAASAASAFALAMKEARLKQQRAIAGGSSRGQPYE